MTERIIIFDSTMRDGDQAPGASMTETQKIELGHRLADLGVDVIEGGFAVSSPEDFDVLNQLSREVAPKGPVICSLARCEQKDIEAAAAALAPAVRIGQGRIHVFVSTSPAHMKTKLNKTPAEVLEMVRSGVRLAKTFTPDVEWSGEDAFRSDRGFLAECVKTAIEEGATTINLPDTVGQASGLQYYHFMQEMQSRVGFPKGVIFSAHCHDDKGLATANSLFAVQAGCRQVECCINGLGERAGNAALEEIVMAIETDKTEYPFRTNIFTKQLKSVSDYVEHVSGFSVSNNKPVVGKTAYSHGSGVHQDGVLKAWARGEKCLYGAIDPALVGDREKIVITRHSGKRAVAYVLKQQGIDTTGKNLCPVMQAVKIAGAKHKILSAEMVRELYEKAR